MSIEAILESNDRIIVFDGVCRFCNFLVRFLIKRDRNKKFKFTAIQSKIGKELCAFYSINTFSVETMLYIEYKQLYYKSSAALQIAKQLDKPWQAFAMFRVVPNRIRDFIYDLVVKFRFRLFGRYKNCLVPSNDDKNRFL